METTDKNQVTIIGQVASCFEFSHEVYGEKFYKVMVSVERLSGICDLLPVLVSERLTDVNDDMTYKGIRVTGQYRSYKKYYLNENGESRKKLELFIFAFEFEPSEVFLDRNIENNHIELVGQLKDDVTDRETPLGRYIANFLVVAERNFGKRDSIPCICWGRNAKYIAKYGAGTKIKLKGRIQSREYMKDGYEKPFTTYEVSASEIEIL